MRQHSMLFKESGRLWLCLILLAGMAIRLYLLGVVPLGLNNDEASIGYDAYALATYGIDRNGYPWPVYPITWGSGGGGPMVIYLGVLAEKLFGHSVFALRLPSAVLGCLTLPLFYLLLRKGFDKKTALIGLLFLCLNPWHIIMSRYTLDCNTFPFWFCAGAFFFVLGGIRKQTAAYLASAVFFALCLYVYGSATVVIPLLLICLAVFMMKNKCMDLRQLILSVTAFLIVLIPLLLFYAVNYLGLPEIVTSWVSVPKFATKRTLFYAFDTSLPQHMWESFRYLVRFLTIGSKDTEVISNQVPGYGTMYRFTFPVTLLGMGCSLRMLFAKGGSRGILNAVMTWTFLISAVFSLFLQPEISRMTMFLVPLLYFFTAGTAFLATHVRRAVPVVALALIAGGCFFVKDYFGQKYADACAENFMPGYGEAVVYAKELSGGEKTINSTYEHVAAPFAVAAYYTKIPVAEYLETVQYRDPDAEFRIAVSFSNYVFGLPQDIRSDAYRDDVLILHEGELAEYPDDMYEIMRFGRFAVVVHK